MACYFRLQQPARPSAQVNALPIPLSWYHGVCHVRLTHALTEDNRGRGTRFPKLSGWTRAKARAGRAAFWPRLPSPRSARRVGPSSCGRGSALQPDGPARDHHQQLAVAKRALGGAGDVGLRHRGDEAVAAGDIVDAEALEGDLGELVGDLGRGVEAERVGAGQVVLRLGKLLVRRAVGLEPQDLGLDRKSTRLNSSYTVISYAV